MADNPQEWAEVIKGAIEHSLDRVHTSIPATITAYTAATQTCEVAPVIEGMPPLTDVPVCWPRGGGFGLHLPLAAGDGVLLVFSEQDFGQWGLTGVAGQPAMLARHGLYAVALPGVSPLVSPSIAASLYSGAVLGGTDPGDAVVHVTSSKVELGIGPAYTQQVAVAALVEGILSGLAIWLQAHTHTCAAPGSPSGPPNELSVFPPTSPVGSTVVSCSG